MEYVQLRPKTTSGSLLTLPDYNNIRFNFEVSVPDIFTEKGDLPVGKYADGVTVLKVGADGDELTPDSTEDGGLIWGCAPAARVYGSGDIDPGVTQWQTLAFDSERFDTHGMHAAGDSQLVCPAGGAGVYAIGGAAMLATNPLTGGGTAYGIRIIHNWETVIAQDGPSLIYYTGYDVSMCIATTYSLMEGDSVLLQVFTGSDVNVSMAGNYSPVFWAVRLRPAVV